MGRELRDLDEAISNGSIEKFKPKNVPRNNQLSPHVSEPRHCNVGLAPTPSAERKSKSIHHQCEEVERLGTVDHRAVLQQTPKNGPYEIESECDDDT